MGQLTEDQWQSLLPWLKRIKPQPLAAARAVLVEGKSYRVAGEAAGLAYQQVHAVVKRILGWQQRVRMNTVATHSPLPEGWVTECFDLPKDQLSTARKLMRGLRAKSGRKKERIVAGKRRAPRSR